MHQDKTVRILLITNREEDYRVLCRLLTSLELPHHGGHPGMGIEPRNGLDCPIQ